MNEIWKFINGFEDYLISNKGNVVSMKNNKYKMLNPSLLNLGYCKVVLRKNSKSYNIYVHQLVAETFILNPENKPEVNHKDGNKLNNWVNNLEWVTHSENLKHAYKIGLHTHKGINHLWHKLSENDVLCIHGLYLNGMKQKEIGMLYNITQGNIFHIVNGKTWKSLF